MLGYYKDPEATKQAFDEEGYFKTGDYGKLDDEGWLYITGRLKNMLVLSNGKNVYPEELEAEITSNIFGVAEVVVYAGESKTKRSHCSGNLPGFRSLENQRHYRCTNLF